MFFFFFFFNKKWSRLKKKAKASNALKFQARKTRNDRQPAPHDPVLEKFLSIVGSCHTNGLNMVPEAWVHKIKRSISKNIYYTLLNKFV